MTTRRRLDLKGVEPWTPAEEAAERAYIAEYVSDPRLRRWIATLDAARAASPSGPDHLGRSGRPHKTR